MRYVGCPFFYSSSFDIVLDEKHFEAGNLYSILMASQGYDDPSQAYTYSSDSSAFNPKSFYSQQVTNNVNNAYFEHNNGPFYGSSFGHLSYQPVVNLFDTYSQPALHPSFFPSQSASNHNYAYSQQPYIPPNPNAATHGHDGYRAAAPETAVLVDDTVPVNKQPPSGQSSSMKPPEIAVPPPIYFESSTLNGNLHLGHLLPFVNHMAAFKLHYKFMKNKGDYWDAFLREHNIKVSDSVGFSISNIQCFMDIEETLFRNVANDYEDDMDGHELQDDTAPHAATQKPGLSCYDQ